MKIKINHGISSIVIDFDTKEKRVSIIKDHSDRFLRNIFNDKNYDGYEKWFLSRFGGKYTIEEVLNLLKTNSGVSAVDKIRIRLV
jgi:hypothetical protein